MEPKPIYTLSADEQRTYGSGSGAPFRMIKHWLALYEEEDRTEATHLDLVGGKYSIPLDKEPQLVALLAAAFQRQEQLDAAEVEKSQRRINFLEQLRQQVLSNGHLQEPADLEPALQQDFRAVYKANGNRESQLKALTDQRQAIEQDLVKDLDSNPNTTCCLVERRTPVFQYVLDLDFAEPTQQIDLERIGAYCKLVQDVLYRFYKKRFELVVCNVPRIMPVRETAKAAKAKSAGQPIQQLYKHGYHIYATGLWLTDVQALTIRELILTELHNQFGPRKIFDNDWTQVVDQCIYIGNGVRITYASKSYLQHCEGKSCSKCRGDPSAKGDHKVIERWRRYVPWRVMSAEGEWDADRLVLFQDKTYALSQLSLRWSQARDPTEGYVRPKEAPQFFPALKQLQLAKEREAAAKAAKNKNKQGQEQEEETAENSDTLGADEYSNDQDCEKKWKTKQPANLADTAINELQMALRHFDLPYKNIVLQRVMLIDNPNPYMIAHVRGQGSQYCKNKGSEHKGNRIWFHISPRGILQKCFCRCDTAAGRIKGKCKDYKSDPVALPPKLIEKLFPNAQVKPIKHKVKPKVEPPAKRIAREIPTPLFGWLPGLPALPDQQ